MKVKITMKAGRVVENREGLEHLFRNLPDGEHIIQAISLIEPTTPEEWRKLYFHLRDLLHESVDTGYTKKELHEELKLRIMSKMVTDSDEHLEWFNEQLPALSTGYLTKTGWKEFIKRLKEFVQDEFEVHL